MIDTVGVDPKAAAAETDVVGGRDRGSVTLENAIVFPGLLAVMMLFFQLGLTAYAHHVVASSVHQAAAVAGASGPGAGQAAGETLLGSIDSITDSTSMSVVSASNEQVTLLGQAKVVTLLPGVAITVKATGTATVERFRAEGEQSP